MQFQFKKIIGNTEFTIVDTAETHKEFIEKASFYSSLPTTAPGGATDLEIVYRTAKTKAGKPCSYYSIVCKSENLEFDLGQSMQIPGQLFSKGWKEAFRPSHENTEDGHEQHNTNTHQAGLNNQNSGLGKQTLGNDAQSESTRTTQKNTGNGFNQTTSHSNNNLGQQNVSSQQNKSYDSIAQKYGLGGN